MTAEDADLVAEVAGQRAEVDALRRELREALEQQTALADVLRVISQSPTDRQAVFDAILDTLARLCGAPNCGLFLPAGDWLEVVAGRDEVQTEAERAANTRRSRAPFSREVTVGRAYLDAQPVHVPDWDAPEALTFAEVERLFLQELGFRASLSVPLLRDGRAVGVISAAKRVPEPFAKREIALVQTFADQAVIAIENARLIEEIRQKSRDLEASNASLREALEQQTATANVLQTISARRSTSRPSSTRWSAAPLGSAIRPEPSSCFAGASGFPR